MTTPTPEQIKAYLGALHAIAEAIRELREVTAGELYARLAGMLTLQQFEAMLAKLVSTGLVSRSQSHVLRWEGSEA